MCYYEYYLLYITVTVLWAIIKLVSLLKCIHLKGERNQLMIWGFTEFITNKKIKNMTFFNENFARADVKAHLYHIDFKFPTKHAGCHFSLISDVTPSIPI